jgi:hypothetical protein
MVYKYWLQLKSHSNTIGFFLPFVMAIFLTQQCIDTTVYETLRMNWLENPKNYILSNDEERQMTIEPDEAVKLGVFRFIAGFDSAKISLTEDDNTVVDIFTPENIYRSDINERLMIKILRSKLKMIINNNFSSRDFDRKWNIAGRDSMGLPITNCEIDRLRNRKKTSCLGCCVGGGIVIIPCWYLMAKYFPIMDPSEGLIPPMHNEGCVIGTVTFSLLGMIGGSMIADKIEKTNKLNFIKKQRTIHCVSRIRR